MIKEKVYRNGAVHGHAGPLHEERAGVHPRLQYHRTVHLQRYSGPSVGYRGYNIFEKDLGNMQSGWCVFDGNCPAYLSVSPYLVPALSILQPCYVNVFFYTVFEGLANCRFFILFFVQKHIILKREEKNDLFVS